MSQLRTNKAKRMAKSLQREGYQINLTKADISTVESAVRVAPLMVPTGEKKISTSTKKPFVKIEKQLKVNPYTQKAYNTFRARFRKVKTA